MYFNKNEYIIHVNHRDYLNSLMSQPSTNQKIITNLNSIQSLYIESKNVTDCKKMFEIYSDCSTYIESTTQLLDNVQNQISRLQMPNSNHSKNNDIKDNIEHYINLLSLKNPNIDQVIQIVGELYSLLATIPAKNQIINNIEKDTIVETL